MKAQFADLVGKTLEQINRVHDEELIFLCSDGDTFRMSHDQDCCESVTIEDICGSLDDLIGAPIIQAEEATDSENPSDIKKTNQDSFTWTFYRIATAKGLVVIRWYGESNGYYSESVNFEKYT